MATNRRVNSKNMLKSPGTNFPSEVHCKLSDSALRVLHSRYLLRDSTGKTIETPSELFWRVARAVAEPEGKWVSGEKRKKIIDAQAQEFFELMASLRFLPNSPTLMNAGKRKGQLSACFVLPLDDDVKQIFETLRDSAVVHKTGGGTGFDFGRIRGKGELVKSSGGVASGPIEFLRVFDHSTQVIKQGGVRRGANMAVLPVNHPDIEEFIQAKRDGGLTNFNVSVGITDQFMRAVKKSARWNLVSPVSGKVVKQICAKSLWAQIAKAAWQCGDPGVLFLDRINDVNPTPQYGPMHTTNPCGEQPLLAYESCNLGSINLVHYLQGKAFNWTKLKRDISIAVRFLDNVIEANCYPLLAIEEITLKNRKIGLGVMGWADALMILGIPYDSSRALKLANELMKKFNRFAIQASEGLAKERGAFPSFINSRWERKGDRPRRNATVTTIAPTGTISIIAGVSSGIEPVFSLAYERQALDGQKLIFVHQAVKSLFERTKLRSESMLLRFLRSGSVRSLSKISDRERRIYRSAMEIKPIWHVQMQSVFQKHVENGVSKTINLPKSTKVSEVQMIYELAYQLGCKGITVFRSESKSAQVLSRGVSKSGVKELLNELS